MWAKKDMEESVQNFRTFTVLLKDFAAILQKETILGGNF